MTALWGDIVDCGNHGLHIADVGHGGSEGSAVDVVIEEDANGSERRWIGCGGAVGDSGVGGCRFCFDDCIDDGGSRMYSYHFDPRGVCDFQYGTEVVDEVGDGAAGEEGVDVSGEVSGE